MIKFPFWFFHWVHDGPVCLGWTDQGIINYILHRYFSKKILFFQGLGYNPSHWKIVIDPENQVQILPTRDQNESEQTKVRLSIKQN